MVAVTHRYKPSDLNNMNGLPSSSGGQRADTVSLVSNQAPAGLSPLPEAPGAVPLLFATPRATHVPQPRAPSSTSDTSLSHLLLTVRPDFSFPSDSDTLPTPSSTCENPCEYWLTQNNLPISRSLN